MIMVLLNTSLNFKKPYQIGIIDFILEKLKQSFISCVAQFGIQVFHDHDSNRSKLQFYILNIFILLY